MAKVINTTIKLKRGQSTEWETKNPVLAAGEPGFELDTGKLKIGNGVDNYNTLNYLAGENISNGEVAGQADWDAAEGEPGYIANKPFHDGTSPAQSFTINPFNISEDTVKVFFEFGEDFEIEDDALIPYYVKVSDIILDKEDIIDSTITVVQGNKNENEETKGIITSVSLGEGYFAVDLMNCAFDSLKEAMPYLVYNIQQDNVQTSFQGLNLNFLEKGLYFLIMPDGTDTMGIKSIKILEKGLKKIKSKYIPTPDWEASENDEGYINNKPFGKEWVYKTMALGNIQEDQTPDFLIPVRNIMGDEIPDYAPEYLGYFKVSDKTPFAEDLIDQTFVMEMRQGENVSTQDNTIYEEQIVSTPEMTVYLQDGIPTIIVTYKDNVSYQGGNIEKKGTYFMYMSFQLPINDTETVFAEQYIMMLEGKCNITTIPEEYLPIGSPDYQVNDPNNPGYIHNRPYVNYSTTIYCYNQYNEPVYINDYEFRNVGRQDQKVFSSSLKSITLDRGTIQNSNDFSFNISNDMYILKVKNYEEINGYYIPDSEGFVYDLETNEDIFNNSYTTDFPYESRIEYLIFNNLNNVGESQYYFKWSNEENKYIAIEPFNEWEVGYRKIPIAYYASNAGEQYINYGNWYGNVYFSTPGWWVLNELDNGDYIQYLDFEYYHNELPFAEIGNDFSDASYDNLNKKVPNYYQITEYINNLYGTESYIIENGWDGIKIPSGQAIKTYVESKLNNINPTVTVETSVNTSTNAVSANAVKNYTYSKTEVDNKIANVQHPTVTVETSVNTSTNAVSANAVKNYTYSKTEVDNKIVDTYSKTEIDDKITEAISNLPIYGGEVE